MAADKINEFKIYKEGGQAEITSIKDKTDQMIKYNTTIIVEVPLDLDAAGKLKYQAQGKPLPTQGLPSDKNYIWFTNFGVNGPKKEKDSKRLEKPYTVTVNAPPQTSDGTPRTLYYADGTEAKPITERNGDKFTFTTDLVDPPVGFYP